MRTLSSTLLLLPFVLACGDKESNDDTTAAVDDSDSTTDDSAATDDSEEVIEGDLQTMSGTITWGVDFDADAEAAGQTDCSYSRDYEGVEDRSAAWLCPSCELLFLADITLDRGDGDCYSQVTTGAPTPVEWIGYANGAWFRSSTSALTERGPATYAGNTVELSQTAPDVPAAAGGTLTFNISGSLDIGATQGDPLHGWSSPDSYSCGWPKADPPEYTGDYTIQEGGILPDGLLLDACDEGVRFHDFKGQYMVLGISAMDCPPCQTAAEQEEAFVELMAGEGLDTTVLTLLAPSLRNTAGTPTTAELQSWIDSYDLHAPVLADRAWGLSVVYPTIPDDFAYPTFVIVDPELTVLDIRTGFGSYDDMAQLIRDHAAGG